MVDDSADIAAEAMRRTVARDAAEAAAAADAAALEASGGGGWRGACRHLDTADWVRGYDGGVSALLAVAEHAQALGRVADDFLAGRTTLLMGDSVTRQLFFFLRCERLRLRCSQPLHSLKGFHFLGAAAALTTQRPG